ncbi:rod shape-determining protein MreC [Chryseobacterium sp. KBW03]|jgi:rod shape-determining protein MreC|uniref:rod shape-determining protein MreC n=1 Tax=unclassified Chryseobacterium TaxID=2593645 RepID=UPI000F5B32FF|nr:MULTISPECIES: rod shape-determining protein MreC [unclassified Chryseobacterium]RQO39280.1 rod shape-determining protein MreC [Chryseobacterium sp. KBW03]UKB79486.1 rod shape-determining protein MreC [Chryseobacterium sp. MEBOG07]
MGFLLRLFSKNTLFVFFIFLQIIALVLIFSRNAMQKSWVAGQTAAFNSWVSGYIDEGVSYLKLKQINEDLVVQNKALMTELYGKDGTKNPVFKRVHDTIGGGQIYTFVDGEIVFNSINRRNNYFTINRGRRDGVFPQMGVMAPKGIAGIVINSTDSYALVQSVLSVNKIRINAALKSSGYFGTLTWNGDNSRVMHLADIPKYVALKVGDTVVTDGKSAIFPKGVTIGTIAGYSVDNKTGFWDISVELSEKMGALNKVYVVKNLKKAEVQKIQDTMQAVIKKEND